MGTCFILNTLLMTAKQNLLPTNPKPVYVGILSVLFARMERICPLRQPYIPHISFGYFKVKEYSMEEIERLNEAILSTNEKHGEALMTLNINSLRFCVHGDMSGYETVMRE